MQFSGLVFLGFHHFEPDHQPEEAAELVRARLEQHVAIGSGALPKSTPGRINFLAGINGKQPLDDYVEVDPMQALEFPSTYLGDTISRRRDGGSGRGARMSNPSATAGACLGRAYEQGTPVLNLLARHERWAEIVSEIAPSESTIHRGILQNAMRGNSPGPRKIWFSFLLRANAGSGRPGSAPENGREPGR